MLVAEGLDPFQGHLAYGEELGSGSFGKVMKAKARHHVRARRNRMKKTFALKEGYPVGELTVYNGMVGVFS